MTYKQITLGFVVVLVLLALSRVVFAYGLILDWEYEQGRSPAIGFNIYQQINDGEFVQIGQVDVDTTRFTVDALSIGDNYTYMVRAFNDMGIESTDSNEASKYIGRPDPVKNLNILEVIIAWVKKYLLFGWV